MRKFEKVSYNDTGILPTRNDSGSAGYDFYAPDDFTIQPHDSYVFKTNIKAQMDDCDVLLLYVRSSIGIKKNLMLCNGTGVIDATFYNNPDNEGNITCALYNYGYEPQTILKGDRVMQGVFVKYFVTDDDVPVHENRLGGIGSSGR